jgi:ribonuclease III
MYSSLIIMSLAYQPRQKELEKLVKKLGLSQQTPIKWHLLDLALTHPSVSAEANYEQLEFIGDSVVRLATSQLLYEIYPDCPVGEFAAIRSILVSDRVLAEIADSYSLDRYLLMSSSVTKDKTSEETRRADAFEALLAVLYLSTNTLELIRPWLDPHLQQKAQQIRHDPARNNYKAALQEWTQSRYKTLPEYQVKEINQLQGNEERFMAEVWFQGSLLGSGKGRSRKAAEQAAAEVAFNQLKKPN